MASTMSKQSGSTYRTAEITVWGLRSLDRALKDLAPDLRRQLYKDLGSVSKSIAESAREKTRALAAMGDESPIGANADKIAAAIKNQRGRKGARGKKSRAALFGFSIVQPHGYGVLAEFARNAKTAQGFALIDAFNRKLGPYQGGRFLWDAMDENRDRVNTEIETAVKAIEAELQRRVDAMTVGTP